MDNYFHGYLGDLSSMADTLLSFGVQKLWDLLVRESDRLSGVNEQLVELKSNLNLLKSFLKDADAKKYASETVRNFVEEIKEIAFDGEDIIDTFLLKDQFRKTSGKKRMKIFSCVIVERRKFASDMGHISKRISKVIRNMQRFGVQQMVLDGAAGEYPHSLQERQRAIRKTFPSNNENDLVGLEENVKKLVGYLVKDDSIQVISITGMGGIGKTTLARQVFNHEMVKTHFDGVAWVCISQQFTRKYVWQTIFQKLSSKSNEQKDSNMTEEELQEKLFRLLETSNSLIVLDDIWKDEDWDMIKPVFSSKRGGKVLLTSRNEDVALYADPNCVILKPECLSIKDSGILFRRIAFSRKDTTEFKADVEIEKMSKQMIKHCGGLPLAVKVLGGLLAARHTLCEWKRVCENIGSRLIGGTSFNEKNISSVYHILYMSFEELPNYLKHCFLYLAHFPEDFTIYVDELSYLWAAEGIPRPRYYDGATIRAVADGYIEELVKRNMIISERDTYSSRYETCRLHDMMREVCLHKAEEENFLKIVHNPSVSNSKSPCKARRIAADKYYTEMMNPKLRSFLLIKQLSWMGSDSFFARLKLMRVLDLSHVEFEGGMLPSSIGKLIHLRYLSLHQARISYLPPSMKNLKKLLYLNLFVYMKPPLCIPNFMKEMRELTYLSLPREIHNEVKMELDTLVNLETLWNFSTKSSKVKDLQGMTRLKALSIYINGRCNLEILSSSLSQLGHLENLTINDNKVYAPMNGENGFVLDCVHLKQLALTIHMPRLPDELHFPCRLTYIYLMGCHLKEDPMPILEKLCQLKEVVLEERSFCGRRMVCSDGGFPKLHKLQLCVEEWEEWIVEKGSMPLLHSLTIQYCPKFKQLPDGLKFNTCLKELNIYRAPLDLGEEWKERLSKGGEDYYKVEHIPFVGIH